MSEVTRILSAIGTGDLTASDKLLPVVYDELRRLAAQRLDAERPGHTLQATALVHEAYLRLVDVAEPQRWNGRGHFFAAAAEAMRRILIESARRMQRHKHGGSLHERVELDDVEVATPDSTGSTVDVLALDEALTRLAELDPIKAKLVKLRFFAGLTLEQAADALGLSPATADRHWAFARAWLFREIGGR
jgi:RNA polymerase sigma factor (TIGR02999 family)